MRIHILDLYEFSRIDLLTRPSSQNKLMRTIGYTGTNFNVDLVVDIGLGLTLAVYTTYHLRHDFTYATMVPESETDSYHASLY